METSFYFIFIGLGIYGLHHLWEKHPVPCTWGIDIAIGAAAGALIGHFNPLIIGYSALPVWLTTLSGALTALMLWSADHLRLFQKRTVQYSLMIIMSLIHASMLLFIYQWRILPHIPDLLQRPDNFSLFIHLLLISAVSFVGFTFPKRILKTRNRN